MLNFPNAPTVDQIFTSGAMSWRWDGVKWVVSGASVSSMVVVTSTTTLSLGFAGYVHIENNTSAPITITMPPTPTTGQQITLKDNLGNTGTYPVTINGNTKNIEGAATMILNFNYSWVTLRYSGVQWVQV